MCVCFCVLYFFLPLLFSHNPIRIKNKDLKASFFVFFFRCPSLSGRCMSLYVYGLKSRRESRNVSIFVSFVVVVWFSLSPNSSGVLHLLKRHPGEIVNNSSFFVARILTDLKKNNPFFSYFCFSLLGSCMCLCSSSPFTDRKVFFFLIFLLVRSGLHICGKHRNIYIYFFLSDAMGNSKAKQKKNL